MLYKPLTRDDVIATIEGRADNVRVPVMIHMWASPNTFNERADAVREILERYPMDAQLIGFSFPDIYNGREDDPEYRWVNYDNPNKSTSSAIDAQIAIDDWSRLDGILESFPNPHYPNMFPNKPEPDGRYRLGLFWFCFFERHWSLRGMTNALMDYYTDPDSVKRLFRALTDFYKVAMERGKEELGLDGVFTSDDIGTQTSEFFSPKVFKEFYKPFYAELIEKAHSLDMHFWLHTCGKIEAFLPDFIEIGLDVVHPIQKYTMDEKKIAAQFGDKICIWAGFDVQQTIPWGTPDEVRQEVRHLIDTYHRPGGRLMLTAGNAIHADCTIESLEAFLDESFRYGSLRCGTGK